MSIEIRITSETDAGRWQKLVEHCIGGTYPAPEVYDTQWIAHEISPNQEHETWIATDGTEIQASISILQSEEKGQLVADLGRNLFRKESFESGAARALLERIHLLCHERRQLGILRVPATDERQQHLLEACHCPCIGYQPLRHNLPIREGVHFYLIPDRSALSRRAPPQDLPSHVFPIACQVLRNVGAVAPLSAREQALGLPLFPTLQCFDAPVEEFQSWRALRALSTQDLKVSTGGYRGSGLLRIASRGAIHAVLAKHDQAIVGGAMFFHDSLDQCIRILDAQTDEGFSIRPLLQYLVRLAQTRFDAVYVEVDVMANAGRLLRCLDQLGFAAVSYLPAFRKQNEHHHDLVKFAKLNIPYAKEWVPFRPAAALVVDTVETHLADPGLGGALFELLRGQALFAGLGEGELRKIALLCRQQVFHTDQKIIHTDEPAQDVYMIVRGEVALRSRASAKADAIREAGGMFGEECLLNEYESGISASALRPTTLLLFGRASFEELMFAEPLLGLTVMRNLAGIVIKSHSN